MTSAFRRSSDSPFRSRKPPPPPSTSYLRTATPSSSSSASLYSRQSAPPPPAKAKENVTVTVRFRPLSAREIGKGDEVAWYADGDSTVPMSSILTFPMDLGTYVEGIKEEVVPLPSPEAVKVIEVINDLLNPTGQNLRIRGLSEYLVLQLLAKCMMWKHNMS